MAHAGSSPHPPSSNDDVARLTIVEHHGGVGELDRSQLLSLVAAAATLVLGLAVSSDLFARLLIPEVACLVFIWCSEPIGRFIGLGITQETPGCFVVAIGWAAQILLLVGVAALVVMRLVHR